MTHLLALVAFGLVLLYAGLVVLLWWFQEQVVFQPPGQVAASAVPARQIHYRTSDGVELFAYLVGDCETGGPLMLAFHGNADLARWLVPWASKVARETNLCVMIPEYRGYDGLPGTPSYEASARDARAALHYAQDSLHVAPANLVFFGHSLGTAIAAELASVVTPRSLVLTSPFSTARAMARRMFVPGLTAFWGIISRVHFDTISRVRALDAPVWVAHGDHDIIIPAEMGRQVFAAAREHGELLIVHGAGHNDVPEKGGSAYWTWLARAVHTVPVRAITADNPTAKRSAP